MHRKMDYIKAYRSFTKVQWCLNCGPRATCGPQGPQEWHAKLSALERKLNTLIIEES